MRPGAGRAICIGLDAFLTIGLMDDSRASLARLDRVLEKWCSRSLCTRAVQTLESTTFHHARTCVCVCVCTCAGRFRAYGEREESYGSFFSVNMFSRSIKSPVGSQRQLITFRRIIYRDSLAPRSWLSRTFSLSLSLFLSLLTRCEEEEEVCWRTDQSIVRLLGPWPIQFLTPSR